MKLWCWKDYSGWGQKLAVVARNRGHKATIFESPARPDAGIVFARIHHHPDVRERDKAVMAYMAVNSDLTLIPSYRASVLYDDKSEQARQFAKWMPRTVIAYSFEDAERALEIVGLPFMSKCAAGAGSHNVRFITSRDQALKEARAAFGAGIAVHYGQKQVGYVLWQKFMPGNAYDFRVIAIGRERLILRRGNRDDRPMASGSNREAPVSWPDAEASEVLDFADSFFAETGMNFCGLDIVRDMESNRWMLLESTTGWPLSNMAAHKFVSGRAGAEFWNLIVDEIEAGRCH